MSDRRQQPKRVPRATNHAAGAQPQRHTARSQERPATPQDWRRRLDQYLARASAAADAGDRVEAENFYQHADHCSRMLHGTAA